MGMTATEIVDLAVLAGKIRGGADQEYLRAQIRADKQNLLSVAAQFVDERPGKAPNWTAEEVAFLRKNNGQLSLDQIADYLGRSPNAVKLYRQRHGIAAPTKKNGYLSGRAVAELLGMSCSKKVGRLIREGVMPGRELPMDREWYVVEMKDLKRWLAQPESWLYFDESEIQDPRLLALVRHKKRRWGDEWWTTVQAAEYHGCHSKDILRYIYAGKIAGHQPFERNSDWYVLRSEAEQLVIRRGKGRGHILNWSRDGDAFTILAGAVGISPEVMAMLKKQDKKRMMHRYRYLLRNNDLITSIIDEYALGVSYDPSRRLIWADWHDYAGRFPRIAGRVRRFLAEQPIDKTGLKIIVGIMRSWASWFGQDMPEDRVNRIAYLANASQEIVFETYLELLGYGIDPFSKEA